MFDPEKNLDNVLDPDLNFLSKQDQTDLIHHHVPKILGIDIESE